MVTDDASVSEDYAVEMTGMTLTEAPSLQEPQGVPTEIAATEIAATPTLKHRSTAFHEGMEAQHDEHREKLARRYRAIWVVA